MIKEFPKISIIIACLNEENYISECLESLLMQDYDGDFDIIVSDGGSKDKTIEIIQILQINNSKIKLINNPNKIQSAGRNIAIESSDAEYIAYIDAHRLAEKSWLSNLWEVYETKTQADLKIVGVGSVHYDASKTNFSKAQEIAFQSLMSGAGSGNFLNKKTVEKVDHACMCLYNKKIITDVGLYDESLPVGEDIELNHRLTILNDYNLYLNPGAINYYHPRKDFSSLLMQQFNYGYWRQIVIAKLRSANKLNSLQMKKIEGMQLKTYIPALFVLFIVLLFIMSFFIDYAFYSYWIIVLIYLFILALASVFYWIINKVSPVNLIIVFVAIHFGYGSGVLTYLFNLKKIRR
ncbi:MAG: glycosyltransferase [Candidatus Kapabacteria bacterium]|nr:glycosyltransferase [Ignavibacteriota bacterium]MCW5883435.1 glycosyltransferase [Candidatus Kapabacteria bacterium]